MKEIRRALIAVWLLVFWVTVAAAQWRSPVQSTFLDTGVTYGLPNCSDPYCVNQTCICQVLRVNNFVTPVQPIHIELPASPTTPSGGLGDVGQMEREKDRSGEVAHEHQFDGGLPKVRHEHEWKAPADIIIKHSLPDSLEFTLNHTGSVHLANPGNKGLAEVELRRAIRGALQDVERNKRHGTVIYDENGMPRVISIPSDAELNQRRTTKKIQGDNNKAQNQGGLVRAISTKSIASTPHRDIVRWTSLQQSSQTVESEPAIGKDVQHLDSSDTQELLKKQNEKIQKLMTDISNKEAEITTLKKTVEKQKDQLNAKFLSRLAVAICPILLLAALTFKWMFGSDHSFKGFGRGFGLPPIFRRLPWIIVLLGMAAFFGAESKSSMRNEPTVDEVSDADTSPHPDRAVAPEEK